MGLFLIQKVDDHYSFLFDSFENLRPWKDSSSFSKEESLLQVVDSNKRRFFIYYAGNDTLAIDYLKMALQEELSKKDDDLDVCYVNDVIVPLIRETCEKTYDISYTEEHLATTNRKIYLFTDTVAYCINQFFIINEIIDNIDAQKVSYRGLLNYYKDLSLYERGMIIFNGYKNKNIQIDYPLIFGKTNEKTIRAEFPNDEHKEINMEEFICHY